MDCPAKYGRTFGDFSARHTLPGTFTTMMTSHALSRCHFAYYFTTALRRIRKHRSRDWPLTRGTVYSSRASNKKKSIRALHLCRRRRALHGRTRATLLVPRVHQHVRGVVSIRNHHGYTLQAPATRQVHHEGAGPGQARSPIGQPVKQRRTAVTPSPSSLLPSGFLFPAPAPPTAPPAPARASPNS